MAGRESMGRGPESSLAVRGARESIGSSNLGSPGPAANYYTSRLHGERASERAILYI